MKKTALFRLGLCALALLHSGCFTARPVSREARLSIISSPRLNLDEKGHAHPLEVRIYCLRSLAAFENSNALALWENDETILRQDLIWKGQKRFFPAREETIRLPREAMAQTGFLGIVANYIQPRLNQNKEAFPMDKLKNFTLKLEPRHLSLEVNIN